MEEAPQTLAYSQIFNSSATQSKASLFKSAPGDRSRTQTELRTLINNVLMHNSHAISTNTLKDEYPPNQSPPGGFNNQAQNTNSLEPKLSKKIVHLKSSSMDKDPIKLNGRSLREKRLCDAQAYRSFHSRESSNSLEKSCHFSKQNSGNTITGKARVTKLQSYNEISPKRKEESSLSLARIPTLTSQENGFSLAYSMDHLPKDRDSSQKGRKNSSVLTASNSCEKLRKIKENLKEKEAWKNYYAKAADPNFSSKFESYSRQRFGSASLERSDASYQKIRLPYTQFLKKNFDDSIIERLDTFGAFAFTSVEREDNKEISNFFSESKQKKEFQGSMGIVDLWSHRLVSELTQRAGFYKEKKVIEKLAFCKTREKKMEKGKKPEFVILHRKNENIYKDLLARQELTKFQKRHENLTLMSSMQRHMPLQGKTFFKLRDRSSETPDSRDNMSDIKEGFTSIINNLNEFAEQNQDDYMRLLEFSASEKNLIKNKVRDLKKIERRAKI